MYILTVEVCSNGIGHLILLGSFEKCLLALVANTHRRSELQNEKIR